MNCLTKTAALALILLIALPSLTLLTSKPVTAQASVTPSVPEFSLKVIDNSYDVPPHPSSTNDPDTGDPIPTTVPGYHVDNKTIQITIKNQPFTPDSSNDKTNNLYYNFSYRGHNEDEWQYYTIHGYESGDDEPQFYSQSTSGYTVIEIEAPSSGEIDFRVRAQIGYYFTYFGDMLSQIWGHYGFSFEGQVSSWSSPQTINVLTGAQTSSILTPTPTSTASPTTTDTTNTPTATTKISGIQSDNSTTTTTLLAAIVVLLVVIAVLLILVLTGWRR